MSTSTKNPPRILTIGGSDSGGSAGIQADIKTGEARGVFVATAITTLTAQNTRGVVSSFAPPDSLIRAQAEAVLSDLNVDALKTGLLMRPEIVGLAAELAEAYHITHRVIDPVLVNGRGIPFTAPGTLEAYQQTLFRGATVITPNLDEARLLTGMDITTKQGLFEAARCLHGFGAGYVLIKGWVEGENIVNLAYDGQTFTEISAPRLPIDNPHGVGCTFASAIACELAKGQPPLNAIEIAHRYLQTALAGSMGWELGQGRLPVFHAIKRPPLE